jgi:thiol-disulfide isomerase/thioredoxin
MLLLLSSTLHLRADGIQFEKGSWKEITAKAAKENKMIYLDVYTTWCGPCKQMAKKYFPQEKAGKLFNTNFINVSTDAEKGEGLELAKKYGVTAYPTNLFLHPKTLEVVYQVAGCPADLHGFLQYGEIALKEYNDPMSIADYKKKFDQGKYDVAFIQEYIQKLNRRNESNDQAMDAFLDKFSKKEDSADVVRFVYTNNKSLTNKGFDFLMKDKKRVIHFGIEEEYQEYADRLLYDAIEWALRSKNEDYFIQSRKKYAQYFPKNEKEILEANYRFYEGFPNEGKQWAAISEYGQFLSQRSIASYDELDKQASKMIEKSIRMQLQQSDLPEDKIEASVKQNMSSDPRMQHSESLQAATVLNEIAWWVFEHRRSDLGSCKQALVWVEKALTLGSTHPESQEAIQDTYACLQYANGNKAEAIKIEERLIQTLSSKKSGANSNIESYQETLRKMKEGTL